MFALFELSVVAGFVAGIVAFVCAYERACLTGNRRQARKLAWQATPGPFLFYLVLGVVISISLPYIVNR
jgi:prepilin signal peptidase PulO-like enzyme (type II secretory pathway)